MIPRDSRLTRHPNCLTNRVHLNVPEGDEATDLCVVIVIQDAAGDFHRFDGAGVLTSMAIRRAETRLIEAAREPYDGGCAPNF